MKCFKGIHRSREASAVRLARLAGAGFFLLSACGGDPEVTADPASIKADGTSTTTITFRDDGNDGAQVYFEVDRGVFIDGEYEYNTATRSLSGGTATVELRSDIQPGPATVVVTTDYGTTASASVQFVRMIPSGGRISFECDAVNIGAIGQPTPDVATPCYFFMRDHDGDPIDPRSLSSDDFGFAAEAGLVHPDLREDYDATYFLYSSRGGDGSPADVDPTEGEPSRAGDTGGTANPRDGLVTIVAWVLGEEGFHDINSNGIFEPGLSETFVDMGEPFLDVDDDGEFNPAAGDVMIDVNGDGRYNQPNGTWDESAIVWTSFKILWTGAPHESPETSRIDSGGTREIPPGATRQIEAHVLDRNLNPIAAQQSDLLTMYPGCYSCDYPSTYTFELRQTRGFEVSETGEIVGNLFEPPTFTLSLTNTNTYEEDEDFSIDVSLSATPAPMTSNGDSIYALDYTLTSFSGVLRAGGSGQ